MSLSKIKLTIISPFPPETGGLSTYTKRLSDHLHTHNEVSLRIIPFNSIADILNFLQIGNSQPDYVRLEYNIPAYGLSTLPLFLIILIYRFCTNIKFVVNYHEVSRETQMLGFIGKVFYYIFSSVFHHLYVHTSEAKQILSQQCGIRSTKITVIAHGITIMDGDSLTSNQIRNIYRLDKRKIVLSFGFIHPDKGIEYLIQAFALIKHSDKTLYNGIQLVIAGDVRKRSGLFTHFQSKDLQYKERLLTLAKELEIEDSVTFLNYIVPKYVKSLLSSAHIAVLPYTKVEQSGVLNVLLPIGIPIIASDIGGLGETLKEIGVLVEPRDAHALAVRIKHLVVDNYYYHDLLLRYTLFIKSITTGRVMNLFVHSLKLIK